MRDRPYGQFNFLVDLGDGTTEGPDAGFQECSSITTSVDVVEYRNGNERENGVRKLPGLEKPDDVMLRRGIIGSLKLYQWIDQVRNGDANALRTVTISLQSEDHSATVMTWRLHRAWPVKYSTGPLNGKGSDVAMEELTLTYERLELE
jgi:phage tail-like protein